MTLAKEVLEKLANGRANCEWSCTTCRSCEVCLHLGESTSPSQLLKEKLTSLGVALMCRRWEREETLHLGEAHGWANHLHDVAQ